MNAAEYLPALLARHGVHVAGPPAPDGLTRRALRGVARRAYRVSANALEPRLRRLAQM